MSDFRDGNAQQWLGCRSKALHHHRWWKCQSELPRMLSVVLANLLCLFDWPRYVVSCPTKQETSAESQIVVVSLLDELSLANTLATFVLPMRGRVVS